MERLTPEGEHIRLNADILRKNFETLLLFRTYYSLSVDTQVERASLLYAYAMKEYIEGGMLFSEKPAGIKAVPLFDSPPDAEKRRGYVRLDMNVKPAIGKVLEECGINGTETHILDNALNHYSHVVNSFARGAFVKVRKASGEIQELPNL